MGIKGLMPLIQEFAPGAVRELQGPEAYTGRIVAIDASMSLYQFLIAIRGHGREGGPATVLTNSEGEQTSHIQGMFNRTIKLLESGVKPVYVFDGRPPEAKDGELAKRQAKRKEAEEIVAKAKKERKQDLRRANSYSDKARGANLAGSLPDEDLAAKLADKAGAKQMKSLAREAPGAKKPKDITGKDTIRTETKSLKEVAREGPVVQKYDAGRPPVQETISDRDRKETTRKEQRELSRKLTGK